MPRPAPSARGPGRRALLAAALLLVTLPLAACGEEPAAPGAAADPQAGATYVGVAVCASCHEEAHGSYLATTHSRALRPVDLGEQPLPHEFTHAASGLTYRMYVKDGQLRVRQSLGMGSGMEPEVLADHAATFTVGSGSSSLSYAADIDGFLVEAPTTWFTAPQSWGMSPGYDVPAHHGFARPLDLRCLHCHVGRTEGLGGSEQRMRVHEQAIGCERCHGPGSAHVEARRREPSIAGPDPTIVNPSALPREAQMDVCAQCHLDHTLSVPLRGTHLEDWRPGLPLDAFRVNYRLAQGEGQMKVVGHVDQLQRSRCYVASGTMTCLSCHDPHDTPAEGERVAYFRAKCLACHTESDPCGMPAASRQATPHGEDCIACHMPRGETDIPHFAFSDHRIAIHGKRAPAPAPRAQDMTLVPSPRGAPVLSPAAQDRHMGLAYLLLSVRRPEDIRRSSLSQTEVDASLQRALVHLERAYAGGERDPAVPAALSFLLRGKDLPRALALAREAEASKDAVTPDVRCSVLQALTSALMLAGKPREALPHFEELIRLRRDASDWALRADALRALGDRAGAMASAREAARIGSHDPQIHGFVARIHAWAGDRASARRHQAIAERLRSVRTR